MKSKGERSDRLQNGLHYFLLAKFLEVLGDKILLFMVPVAVYLATKDVRLSGIVTIMQWLPRVLLQPFLSTFVNGLPMRVQFVAIGVLKAVLCGGMFVFGRNIPFVLVSVSVVSMMNGCSFVNLEAIGGTIKNKSDRAVFQGHVQTIDRTSRILGPAIGGFAIGQIGFGMSCLLVASLLLANVLILVIGFKMNRGGRAVRWRDLNREVASAVMHIIKTPPLLLLLLFMMIGNFLEGMLVTFLPKLVVSTFHAQPTSIALIEVGTALFTIAALYAMPRLAGSLVMAVETLFAPALVLMILSSLFFAVAKNIVLLAMAFAVFFAAQSITTIYIRVHRIEYIPESRFATTMGVALSLVQVTLPVSGYLIATFSPIASYQEIIGVGVAGSACAFWLIWRFYRRVEKSDFASI
jgi:predicted MFS family arabinose efflux permease